MPSVFLNDASQGNWLIEPDELKLDEVVGVGSFGKVYCGTFRGKKVAVKKVHASQMGEPKLKEFQNELNTMWYAVGGRS